MSKSNSSPESEARASVSLFMKPTPIPAKPSVKTTIIVPLKNDDGSTVPQPICIEDAMQKMVALNFEEVSLSNLVDKGVEPHALDMIDTQKLGVDAGVDSLANHIINNVSDYVESPKSPEK